MHHIISDGMSVQVFMREFAALFAGESLPELRVQYKDYTLWRQSDAQRGAAAGQQEFWLGVFDGEIPVLNLPLDYPRPPVQGFEGATFGFRLDRGLTSGLTGLALEHGASLFMVLAALFNLVLSRFSGQEDIVVGTPVAGRSHADLEPVIGMFVNTLALRSFPRWELPFDDYLKEVKEVTLEAFENQEYPFEMLVDGLALQRDAARSPLFDVMFNLVNIGAAAPAGTAGLAGGRPEDGGISLAEQELERTVSRFDMTWSAEEREGELHVDVEYGTCLFKEHTVRRFTLAFEKAARRVLQSSAARLGEIDILAEAEKQRLLTGFNAAPQEYPGDRTIPGLFYRQVERSPHAVAVVDGEHAVSYRELAYLGGHVASMLRQENPVSGTVGVMAERSLQLITGLLGILMAGYAYVPLDPKAPAERSSYILEDSNTSILLHHSAEPLKGFPESLRLIELCGVPDDGKDDDAAGILGDRSQDALCDSHDLAYIIYTSGSTGRPKGVPITHGNLSPLLFWGHECLGLGVRDRAFQNLSYFFDWSAWEIFITLTTGASLHMFPGEVLLNPERCVREIDRARITVLHVTPSQYRYYLETGGRLETLRYLFLGAETLTPNLLERSFSSVPAQCRVFNMYGPTEATIIASVLEISRRDWKKYRHLGSIPIGGPVYNSVLLVLDRLGGLSPQGVPGELFIGGPGVAQGYLNNPGLTAERFAPSPYFPLPSRFYKTGDLARWLDDGVVEFLGRMDQQVKVRGFRIELGEIENRVLEHPGVREAVVTTHELRPGNVVLCAYIIPPADGALEPGELGAFLGRRLPDYMVPRHFIPLETIPLTPNGKVDLRALPVPGIEEDAGFTPPTGPGEKTLAGIWAGVLSIERERIGAGTDFFQLGGHSLNAVVMTARVYKRFGVNLPLTDIFRTPVLRDLARVIDERRDTGKEIFTAVEPVEEKEYYPLSSAQKRLYILQQMELESTVYNIPDYKPLPPDFFGGDASILVEKLQAVFRQLIRRHESFRTSFHGIGGQPAQVIHDDVDFNIEYVPLPQAGISSSFSPLPSPLSPLPFDPTRSPLLRVVLAGPSSPSSPPSPPSPSYLFIDMHHIISDGTSMEVLTGEFLSLYRGEPLPPLTVRYRDYAEWGLKDTVLENLAAQEGFWLEQFSGDIPVLNLPLDFPRPPVQSFDGRTVHFYMDEPGTAGARQLAREQGVTLYMVFLAAFNLFLARIAGQEDIVVGTPVAGRRHADLERVIGMFVNTLALRNRPHGDLTFAGFLETVKNTTLRAFDNQEYPFEDLVERAGVLRDAGRNPLFDVMFTLTPAKTPETGGADAPGGDAGESPWEYNISKFDLSFSVTEFRHRLVGGFEYALRLFRPQTIERFIQWFQRLLPAVLEDPGILLRDVDFITPRERQLILEEFNGAAADVPAGITLWGQLEKQASAHPERRALLSGGRVYTYGEIYRSARAAGRRLRQNGAGPGVIAAVMMDRSVELVTGILAILSTGAAYLPLDPAYPEERTRYILADSNASFLLVDSAVQKPGPDSTDRFSTCPKHLRLIEWRGLPGDRENLDEGAILGDRSQTCPYDSESEMIAGREDAADAGQLAYIIYTSGSTGRPKGVAVEHRSAANTLWTMQEYYPLDTGDVYLLKTSVTFDVSVTELFGWFFGNGALALLEKDGEKDPRAILRSIVALQVTHINFVPSMFNVFVDLLERENTARLSSLKHIFLAGEALLPGVVERFRTLGSTVTLENIYGPTEAAIYSSLYPLAAWEPGAPVPIGKPFPNMSLFILDVYGRIQPIGVAGELCIAGPGVARGYLNNPELTAERFVCSEGRGERGEGSKNKNGAPALARAEGPASPNTQSPIPNQQGAEGPASLPSPLSPLPSLLYRTGDLARWLNDGNIEFLGRMDFQVKVRGFRIELGEIQDRLMQHPSVREAVVTAAETAQGEKELCAYLVPREPVEGDQGAWTAGLREFLLLRLPEYMAPSYFVSLEALPMTPGGKIDTRALPGPGAVETGEILRPADEMEARLLDIWGRVLGLLPEQISVDTGFFQLGGHSLKATVMVGNIHRDFDIEVPLSAVFTHSTIRRLARYLGERGAVETPGFLSIPQVEEREYYPLSSAQQRLFVLQQMDPGGTVYNMPQVIPLPTRPETARLEQVFHQLIRRHESLRTSFHMVDGQPVQRIHAEVDFTIEEHSGSSESIPTAPDSSLLSTPNSLLRTSAMPEPRVSNSPGTCRLPGQEQASLFPTIGQVIGDEEKICHVWSRLHYVATTAFTLSRAPLLRVVLTGPHGAAASSPSSPSLPSSPSFLFIDMHHIISDGVSIEILTGEFQALYRGETLPPLKPRYRDYASWQNSETQRGVLKQQETWWLRELTAPLPQLNLPLDYSRPAVQDFSGLDYAFPVGPGVTARLKSLALGAEGSLFMLLTAVLNILLSRLSGMEDIIVGTPVAGRRHAQLQDIIGMFVNTLALRNRPAGETPFNDFFPEVKERTLAAFENQDYPFDALVDQLPLERDAGRNPVFDVMLSFYTSHSAEGNQKEKENETGTGTGRCGGSEENVPEQVPAKFDITLTVEDRGGPLQCSFQYARALFKPGTMERFSGYFLRLLESVTRDPGRRLADMDILPERERRQLLLDFNRTGGPYPTDTTIPGLFQRQVDVRPEAPAVVDCGRVVTYGELARRCARLSSLLRREAPVPGLVGILADRSLELITGILAVLGAGYAYVPLNPTAPPERNAYILQDANVSILLHYSAAPEGNERLSGFPESLRLIELCGVPDEGKVLDAAGILGGSNDLAYVIYTSGTTGRPKGVPITHGNFSQLIHWGYRDLDIGPFDRVMQNLSYYFDWSVWEIFIALTTGASLYLPPGEHRADPAAESILWRNRASPFCMSPLRSGVITWRRGVSRKVCGIYSSAPRNCRRTWCGAVLGPLMTAAVCITCTVLPRPPLSPPYWKSPVTAKPVTNISVVSPSAGRLETPPYTYWTATTTPAPSPWRANYTSAEKGFPEGISTTRNSPRSGL